MDDKWKSRKLFVWIVFTLIFIGCVITAVFTEKDIFSEKFFVIYLIGWFIVTAFYLLGQTLIDLIEKNISIIVEKVADKLSNKIGG